MKAIFNLKDKIMIEQSTSTSEGAIINKVMEDLELLEVSEQVKLASWQEILEKVVPILRLEFHRRLNSIRDLNTLTTYCNEVRRKKKANGITHDYVIT